MSSEPNPPVAPGGHPLRKLIWLIVALAPSFVGLLCVATRADLDRLLRLLVILNAGFCLLAAAGFVVDMKNPVGRFFLGCFLWGFFCVLNAGVVFAAACAQMLHS